MMKTIDRILIATLSIGVWVLVAGLYVSQPAYAVEVDASDVYGLERAIEKVVEKTGIDVSDIDGLDDAITDVVETCAAFPPLQLNSRDHDHGIDSISGWSIRC